MSHYRTSPATALGDRPGVNPARVVKASVDRLQWTKSPASGKARAMKPGTVDPDPVAVARHSTMLRAVDPDGGPRFVRLAAPALAAGYRGVHEQLHSLAEGAGFVVPAVTRVATGQVWLTRYAWDPGGHPSYEAIDRYVAGVLETVMRTGMIVATGQPHVLPGGEIVCEDVVIAQQMEHDQRAVLAAVIAGLIRNRPAAVADAVRNLCQGSVAGVVDAARRNCLSLRVQWSPTAFGLSLSMIASAAVAAGPRSDPLVLLADEMLHRLDLAHQHQYQPRALRSPECVEHLLDHACHLV